MDVAKALKKMIDDAHHRGYEEGKRAGSDEYDKLHRVNKCHVNSLNSLRNERDKLRDEVIAVCEERDRLREELATMQKSRDEWRDVATGLRSKFDEAKSELSDTLASRDERRNTAESRIKEKIAVKVGDKFTTDGITYTIRQWVGSDAVVEVSGYTLGDFKFLAPYHFILRAWR